MDIERVTRDYENSAHKTGIFCAQGKKKLSFGTSGALLDRAVT